MKRAAVGHYAMKNGAMQGTERGGKMVSVGTIQGTGFPTRSTCEKAHNAINHLHSAVVILLINKSATIYISILSGYLVTSGSNNTVNFCFS